MRAHFGVSVGMGLGMFLGFVCCAGPAHAGPITLASYDLTTTNGLATPNPGSYVFGTVALTAEATAGGLYESILVTVGVNPTAFEDAGWEVGPKFGIDKLGVNLGSLDVGEVQGLPLNWVSPKPGGNTLNSFGEFSFTAAGRNGGNSRQTSLGLELVLDTDYTHDALVQALTNNAPYPVAAHIRGFGPDGDYSAFFSVPEPATVLLMGCALAGLGLAARRRNRKASSKD